MIYFVIKKQAGHDGPGSLTWDWLALAAIFCIGEESF